MRSSALFWDWPIYLQLSNKKLHSIIARAVWRLHSYNKNRYRGFVASSFPITAKKIAIFVSLPWNLPRSYRGENYPFISNSLQTTLNLYKPWKLLSGNAHERSAKRLCRRIELLIEKENCFTFFIIFKLVFNVFMLEINVFLHLWSFLPAQWVLISVPVSSLAEASLSFNIHNVPCSGISGPRKRLIFTQHKIELFAKIAKLPIPNWNAVGVFEYDVHCRWSRIHYGKKIFVDPFKEAEMQQKINVLGY